MKEFLIDVEERTSQRGEGPKEDLSGKTRIPLHYPYVDRMVK